MKKIISIILICVIFCTMTAPAFAYNYDFSSGDDTLSIFGKPTSNDEPVSPDPLSENVRRNKDAAYLPPPYFSRFVTPYLKEMTELIHRYGGLARIHSHGRIGKVLDDIISCGADSLDPCEAPPDGDITLRELKAVTSGKMCLFGNIQLKSLEHADTHEIRGIVRVCMDSAKEGGGYVIMPTAAPINIPLSPKTEENYRIFIETALEYGKY